MRVAVVNYCGTVGKTTVASHLLAPRLKDAGVIIAVETVNETAAELGLRVDQLRGTRFGELYKRLMATEEAIVDVGASNAEEFIGRMGRFAGSEAEFDYFVVPTTSGSREQRETIKTVKALAEVGVSAERIRVLLNRVMEDAVEEFGAVLGFADASRCCTANSRAAIHENEVFNLLNEKQITLSAILADETDYRSLVRALDKDREPEKVAHAAQMHAIRSLARTVHKELDLAFEQLFRAAA